MTLHRNAHVHCEVERFFVGHPELFGELMQPDVLRHLVPFSLSSQQLGG
jgi:hypothetical protein